MPDEKASSSRFQIAFYIGSVLIVAGVVWSLLLLTTNNEATVVASGQRPTVPTSPGAPEIPGLVSLSAPRLYDTSLGTRSIEFSAVTLNESTNRLLIADDEGRLFEFDIAADGDLVIPARRSVQIDVGDSDIEGIAWLEDTTYVLAHEADGVLSIVEIPEVVTVVNEQHRLRTIKTGIVGTGGTGIEGVTVSQNPDAAFVVVVEQPPSLRFISNDGASEQIVPLQIGLADVSDLWAAADGTIWVVSHEDSVIVRLAIDDDGTIVQMQQVDLVFPAGRFPQAEGIVMSRDGTRLYVVGEGSAPHEFTFAFWSVDPG